MSYPPSQQIRVLSVHSEPEKLASFHVIDLEPSVLFSLPVPIFHTLYYYIISDICTLIHVFMCILVS